VKRILPAFLFFVLGSLVYPSTGFAETIFSNISNSPNPVCCGYAVGTYPATTNVFIDTFPFTPLGNSFRLDRVGLLESEINNLLVPAGLTLFLFKDSSDAPGGVLESWINIPVTPLITHEMAVSLVHPILQQGQQYWFGVTTTTPQDTAVWWINPGLVTARGCANINGGPYFCADGAAGAFEILGTRTVPAPVTLLLLGAGFAGLAGRIAWRNRGRT
jgi:hypothetical protein